MRDPVTALAARIVARRPTGELADEVFELMRRTLSTHQEAGAVQLAQQHPQAEGSLAALEEVIYAHYLADTGFADALRHVIGRWQNQARTLARTPDAAAPHPGAGPAVPNEPRDAPAVNPAPSHANVAGSPPPDAVPPVPARRPPRASPAERAAPPRGYPVAWVDDTHLYLGPGHPGVQLFAAVIVEGRDVETVRQLANDVPPDGAYNSARSYHHGHVGQIETMLNVVKRHVAWTAVIAHTPVGAQPEESRQVGLRQLLGYLDQQKVRDVILGVRGDQREWIDALRGGQSMPAINYRDVRTYKHMVASKQINGRMRIMHHPDGADPGLWLADAVAWAAHRALSKDEPQWWSRIAEASTVLDAVTGAELHLQQLGGRQEIGAAPPSGEVGPHSWSQRAQAMLAQAYTDIERAGYNTRLVGSHLADLLRQTTDARTRPATAEQSAQVLQELRRIERRIADLATEVRGRHSPDPSPQASTPDTDIAAGHSTTTTPPSAGRGPTELELE